MDENLKQRLEELRKEQQDIEAERNDIKSKEVELMVKESEVNDEIARLEEQERNAEELRAKVMEAEKLAAEKLEAERLEAERLNAVRIEYEKQQVERLAAERAAEAEKLAAEKAEAEILEAEKAEKEKVKNPTVNDYLKMLENYNKKLESYNKKVPKLYTLQKQYEKGKIEYEEYEKYATPLAEEYMSIKEMYEELVELHGRLNKRPSLESLTDEELNERLNNLNDEYKKELNKNSYNTNNTPMQGSGYGPNNTNNVDNVNITKLGKINSDISNIKNEQSRRKNVASAKALSNEELDSNINALKSALQSGIYDQDSKKIEDIKRVLSLLTNEKIDRSGPYNSLTNEQIDVEIAKLNEEYINEWNYSAHEANGMEANDSSKLEKIKEKINMLNTVKSSRGNGDILNLEMPKAPLTAMFITRRDKNIPPVIPEAPTPTVDPSTPPKPEPTIDPNVGSVPEPTPEPSPELTADPSVGPAPEPQNTTTPVNNNSQPNSDISNVSANFQTDDIDNVADSTAQINAEAQKASELYYKQLFRQQKWYQRFGSSIKGWFTRTFSRSNNKSLSSGLTSASLKESHKNSENTNTFAENLQKYKTEPTSIKDTSGNIPIDIYENSSKVPKGNKTPDEIDL